MKKSFFLFLALGFILALQSCTKEDALEAPDNLAAPSIPPTDVFTIPTQTFGIAEDQTIATTRNDKSNWVHAGLNVLVWNTVVFVNTAIPIAAFGHSFNYESEFIGDLTWQWKYEYQAPPANGSTKYDVTLTGQYINNLEDVAWKMVVQEAGTSNEIVWYEGIVKANHSEGSFTVNRYPQNPEPYVTLSFNKDFDKDNVTIRFTNVIPNDPGNGDFIEWMAEPTGEYDRHYDVSTDGNLIEIEANELEKNGRVKDPKHFEDEEWHCWDTNQKNIDC
ncbi:MAG: hypothetical protein P1U56_25575 [Saprospiraceae bacterium]|nr:hypothetical protein [Saprospiraceae bacterium]